MALLFADVVDRYNAEKRSKVSDAELSDNELSNRVADFLDSIDEDDEPAVEPYELCTDVRVTPQKVFVASLASEYYDKAIDDIANTTVGNKAVRKKNFRQVMQESFFYGSNRFGNNFIA